LLEKSEGGQEVLGRPALIVGAGGASRAAVYTLHEHFKASVIYVLNRDIQEVQDLIKDVQRLSPPPRIIHVRSKPTKALETPYYVVGTVPDFEPKTAEEIVVKDSLTEFLARGEKGVLLDMCFKPRRTRMIQLAESFGWECVEGTHVIGYQIEDQYRLWAGHEAAKTVDKQGAWKVLMDQADSSPGINY
jgi:quinate dehydrogenase